MRRYLPFVVFSLAFHGCLLAVFSLWKFSRETMPEQRRVVLEFHSGTTRRSAPAGTAGGPLARSSSARRGMNVDDAGALALPAAAPRAGESVRPAASAFAPARIERLDSPRLGGAGAAAAVPSAAEALEKALAAAGRERPASMREAAEPAGGYTQETALEWEGRTRRMLRSPQLRFPELLAEKGLEADVEAAFVVAPNGQVTQVQITRSSGFASVDRAVIQALQNALFDASPFGAEDLGRIRFHFRLEHSP